MNVVVLNGVKVNYDGLAGYDSLGDEVVCYDASTPEQYAERAEGAEVLVSKELPMNADAIRALPDCVKLICEAGTGYNNIDLAACREKGIKVANVPAYSTDRVAQTAVMMLLNLSSEMGKQIRALEKGDRSNFTKYLGVSHTEVNGKTLGVVGAGNIGGKVIEIAKALGMNVLVYTRTPKDLGAGTKNVSLEELLRESDYVTLHCPLTPATKHMINEETLKLMKPTACLINASRGALVDEPALIRALQEGRLAGAGLDVQETEPPAADNPLYDMPNVILTPHMGWKGLETRQRLVQVLADNIAAYARGEKHNIVSE